MIRVWLCQHFKFPLYFLLVVCTWELKVKVRDLRSCHSYDLYHIHFTLLLFRNVLWPRTIAFCCIFCRLISGNEVSRMRPNFPRRVWHKFIDWRLPAPANNHVIGFSALVDLWVFKIKNYMILCARSTSKSSEQSTKRRSRICTRSWINNAISAPPS